MGFSYYYSIKVDNETTKPYEAIFMKWVPVIDIAWLSQVCDERSLTVTGINDELAWP